VPPGLPGTLLIPAAGIAWAVLVAENRTWPGSWVGVMAVLFENPIAVVDIRYHFS
jgi:hypothetical protein